MNAHKAAEQIPLFALAVLKALGLGKRPRTVIFRCPACGYAEKDRLQKRKARYTLGLRAVPVRDHRLVLGCPSCDTDMLGDVVGARNKKPRCHPRCRFARHPVCECECNGRYHQRGNA